MVSCAGHTLGNWGKRMKRVLAGVVVGFGLVPVVGHADTVKEAIIQQLAADGYGQITVSRTLLGRLRFVATGANGTREVVVQPSNGAVLRDHVDDDDNDRSVSRSLSETSEDLTDRSASEDESDDRGDRDNDRDDDKGGKGGRDDDRGGDRDNDKGDRGKDRGGD